MAEQRDLEVDYLRDAYIRKAYAEGRLTFRPGLGPLHCPHCAKGMGVLLPGNALGRTAASRTLLTVCPTKLIGDAVEQGDVVVVVPKIRKVSSNDRKRAERAGIVLYDDCIEAAVAVLEQESRENSR